MTTPKLKSAGSWYFEGGFDSFHNEITCAESDFDDAHIVWRIKQIQADTLRYAAELCRHNADLVMGDMITEKCYTRGANLRDEQDILTAANNLEGVKE